MRHAISITLKKDNVLWVRGQAAAKTGGNVSEFLDTLIAQARTAGRTDAAGIKSVVGTIDLPDDEALGEADGYVRTLFDRSLSRPMLVRESPPKRPKRG